MEGFIASPHWEACRTCAHHGDGGCRLGENITLAIYLGDWIICEDYEKEQTNAAELLAGSKVDGPKPSVLSFDHKPGDIIAIGLFQPLARSSGKKG